ncbi:hypothetical protein [Xanthomonas hortorum]|uniref:Transmembrane protein n=1 Tax=Xanthomonas hortorum pv. pelargonii TaxID=453602 RepID=A0AAX0A1X1_9XANT|nr:hypothetical protein [Xanthomonas hortorum]MCE4355993.1 hypothetical protein [Xanthomonas hortorum pv. pelargonii]MCM5525675.1 hypothetical protein [Xanthomonas hortorum pv. pelargonii]MCM5535750.1 hypothetical protein [Xanthomonas hortorum pv. pelargonii]MCM5539843.1 hypothetical protein [Xanthomonas hortorum pv. pelargonii]MCM5546045.1 hypothetical protein [Xanthomonas hortorum pv. pelargonii]
MKLFQADAVAQAILMRDPAEQEALRLKRAKEAQWLIEQRKVAGLSLAGFVAGAAVAHFFGERWVTGGLLGSLLGAAAGWIWISGRNPPDNWLKPNPLHKWA